MYKIVGVLAIILIGYLMFFREPSPDVIYFNGSEYGPRQLDRSNDSNSKIYNYYSKSISNKDYIAILYPGSGSPRSWSRVFSKHFEGQGFKFSTDGRAKVGIKNTVKLYMIPSDEKGVVFMYILEDINNSDHIDESEIFRHLEAVVLD